MATYRPGTTGWFQENKVKPGSSTTKASGGTTGKITVSSGSGGNVNKTGLYTGGTASAGGGKSGPTIAGASKNDPYTSGKDDYGETDYSVLINNAMKAGAGADEVKSLLDQRTQKALDKGYSQYAYDKVYSAAQNYIRQNQAPEYQYQFNSIEEMRAAMGYDQASAAQQAAIDAYIKQQVNSLESQKSGITQSADEAARQAYISYMRSQATLPQALAATGYSGGMADSQRLALETGLQNNQREILMNRDNALNGVDTAIQQAKLEGSIQGAQAQAELGRDAINAYQQYINQQNAYANQDFWSKYGYDFQGGQAQADRDFQAGQSQLDRDWQSSQSQMDQETVQQQAARKLLQSQVLEMIQAGQLPGDDLLEAAGISKAYAQTMAPFYASQLTAQTAGQGSGTVRQSNVQYLPKGGEDGDNIKTPVSAITSISQLGPVASKIANGMSRVTMSENKAGYIDLIEKALKNQSISAEEAQYLLDMIGIAP